MVSSQGKVFSNVKRGDGPMKASGNMERWICSERVGGRTEHLIKVSGGTALKRDKAHWYMLMVLCIRANFNMISQTVKAKKRLRTVVFIPAI